LGGKILAEELGYFFHPVENDALHGHLQLDVNIYREPTGKHFDPEQLTIWVVDSKRQVSRQTISHPYQGHKQFAVCVGRISLRDRKDKVIEAFSFGSDLRLTVYENHTNGIFTSTAPIYQLRDSFQDPSSLVVSEFEVLLARAEADWGHRGEDLRGKLAGIAPFDLFVAGLVAVRNRLRRLPRGGGRSRTLRAINAVIRLLQLEKKWPTSPVTLSDLLKCDS
jgi:hypothetical protein